MRYFILALLLLPGCPGPDMPIYVDGGPPMGDSGPGDAGLGQDAGSADAGLNQDAYMAPEQDSGVDAPPSSDTADAGPALNPDLDRFEVSWGQWAWFESGGRPDGAGGQVEAPRADLGCTAGLGDSYPVTCVSQASAEAFCRFMGLRLPTRAEWLSEASAVPQDSDEVTGAAAPAPTTRASVCDQLLCDTHGNVAELVTEGVAMGAAFDDAAPGLGERAAEGPDVHIGFRCRSL